MEQVDALKQFFRWAMQEGPFDGCDLDGGGVQDKAEALGLIVKAKYDPAIHGEQDIDPGDEIFVFAPGLTS